MAAACIGGAVETARAVTPPSPAPADPSAADAGERGREPAEALRVTRQLSIPLSELTWRFTTSGGPGGQHANRAHSRAEVSFDIAHSPSLGPRQRSRLLARLGPSVRTGSSQERSQRRNRDRALDRLADKLRAALRVEPARVATAPSPAARRRRLEDKKHRSATKRERSRRDLLD